MRVAVFSTKSYDRQFLEAANRNGDHELVFFEPGLGTMTVSLGYGFPALCAFVNDVLDVETLSPLAANGTRLIALRAAGFNNVDVEAARRLGLTVLRVPAYSPHGVAEHTVGLILTLNRRFHRAFARVREQDFSLEGLLGFDLNRRTVGVVGTGKIGALVARIMKGFGCPILACDVVQNPKCVADGVRYVSLPELVKRSDIITLHCPLTPETHHLVDGPLLERMKPGIMLINTSRGGLIDTKAVIQALKTGSIGHLGIDVYEEESHLFFNDLSDTVIQDDIFARLLTFPNVVITAHQGFFTREALTDIAQTTIQNITDFERGAIREENRVGGN